MGQLLVLFLIIALTSAGLRNPGTAPIPRGLRAWCAQQQPELRLPLEFQLRALLSLCRKLGFKSGAEMSFGVGTCLSFPRGQHTRNLPRIPVGAG